VTVPATLSLRGRTVPIEPGRPLLMGIVNAGPDSFSDRLRLRTLGDQVDHALSLIADGADLIDVGGESGVTYTAPTAAEVEIERVVPLVERLAAEGVTVSVDTWKRDVAAAAVAAGAAIINDVSGLRDPALADVAAATGAALVVMHTRAAPKQASFAGYEGAVVDDVAAFLPERLALARGRGVHDEQLIVDPGPDFAKSPQESVEALRSIGRLVALGRPVLLAVSRKYFIGAITGREPQDRLAGTLAAVGYGVAAGAAIVRVHDIAAVVDHLRVSRVLEGADPVPEFDAQDDRLKWIRSR
jgi:dihydropteroate synthase